MTQTNPHPEQLSDCCNAPVVFVRGNAWDVPPESISRGSTYGYGCTACKKVCSPLPSTDSPEPSTTDPTYNLDEIQQCKGCGLSNHVDSRGYCGRCNGPVESELFRVTPDFSVLPEFPILLTPTQYASVLAWKQAAVDAAVAAALTQHLDTLNIVEPIAEILPDNDWMELGRRKRVIEEQLKNRENHG